MASTKVVVSLPDGTEYDVRIGGGLLPGLGEYARSCDTSRRALVITDSNVGPLYLEKAKASLVQAGYQVVDISIPAGESSKSIDCATEIWEAMAQKNFSRDSTIFALGGGVVGDMAGFIAATYLRGIEVVQVPTSLLAMVDSSVGGKTGVNIAAGKNLVGAFKQPRYVCASIETLATLSSKDWACGCAEIAKSAVIDSDDFFFWLSGSADALAARDESTVIEAITRSVVFKANVVAEDTLERKGVRECLNYGHTLGHAIELLSGFGTFSHGAAVAEGMRFAARLGAELLGTSTDFVLEQDNLLDTLGLPELTWTAEPSMMLEAMMKDKKVRDGSLRFVLPRDIGEWELVDVEEATLLEHLEAWSQARQR